MATEQEIMQALSKVNDPELGRNLVDLEMIKDLQIGADGVVSFTLALTVPTCPMREQMAYQARTEIKALSGVSDVQIAFRAMTEPERQAVFSKAGQPRLPDLTQMNRVRHMVAVMSGKGGVGKSSVTAMLAADLMRRGLKVGILDADITGPSIPKMFGLPPGGLRGGEQGMLPAATKGGIKVVSTNLLVPTEDTPVIWRGPMITGAITQFWQNVLWGRLDVLLIDLPPGTSDATLAVVNSLPIDGVIMVTTPQDLSALVVRKAVRMVQQLNVPILGVVENMSFYRCPDTSAPHYIFGPSHVEEIAELAGANLWTRVPINPQISMLCDAGQAEQLALPEVQVLADHLLQLEPRPGVARQV
ncbi:MAG TPA: Mrp/NBP35 family ATP-binding protein [Anaerolineaceae bacterium]|nr:Mrp/NBP35 family ATP-binding protein [Anaerolineaceae bacterium]